MKDSFNNIYDGVPKDVLCEAIMAQYAECEVTHHRALTSTWELERHVNLTIATPTSDPSISTPSTQVLPTLWALSCPQPYPLS